MAFCSKCGAQLPDNSAVCPSCGAPQQNNGGQQQTYVNQQPNYTNGVGMDPNDAQQNKAMGILAYFGILFLIPLLAAPNSRFARFHANQGLVLFLAEIVLGVIAAIPIVGWVIGSLGEVAALVFAIIGIVNAANGEVKELPLIGRISIIK
ncbi:MAG: zinc-ribbon domain-containing protein [Bacteroides sp.]|nr:zinc-ribbon domain-containing protein [Bacteroides sp.]